MVSLSNHKVVAQLHSPGLVVRQAHHEPSRPSPMSSRRDPGSISRSHPSRKVAKRSRTHPRHCATGSASVCNSLASAPPIRWSNNRVSSTPAANTSSLMLSMAGYNMGKIPEVCL